MQVIQVSSTSFPSPVLPNPSPTPAHTLSSWQRGARTAGMPASPDTAPHRFHLPENVSVVQDGFLMGCVHRRHKVRDPLDGRLLQLFAEGQFE